MLAKSVSRLKRYGCVQVDIGVLADKSWHEIPEGGSPWHEYAMSIPTVAKFFPHPKIAPFFPADWVAKNRSLLLAKAAILREMGLESAFSSNDTQYLPEAFFRRYPHLRGPSVDHPRRSKRAEFSMCVDLDGVYINEMPCRRSRSTARRPPRANTNARRRYCHRSAIPPPFWKCWFPDYRCPARSHPQPPC